MKLLDPKLLVLFIIYLLLIAGCVAPPKPGTSPSSYPGSSGSAQGIEALTPTPEYVTQATLFSTVTPTVQGQGYITFPPTTPIAADLSCLIDLRSLVGYQTTAITFDLKNPPMYINYSVTPSNITITRTIVDPNTKAESLQSWSTYSPYSWFEVTVRNKTSGKIYLQDGFGTQKGYTTYLNQTLKVFNQGDLQIEYISNNITATAGIWVKPLQNFDNRQPSDFSECKYWDHPVNVLPFATATPTPTQYATS
ncbi:MAG: hypothetical protein ABR887_00865 [Methanoregulaceae archaeon]|jgi:hypothetical protein